LLQSGPAAATWRALALDGADERIGARPFGVLAKPARVVENEGVRNALQAEARGHLSIRVGIGLQPAHFGPVEARSGGEHGGLGNPAAHAVAPPQEQDVKQGRGRCRIDIELGSSRVPHRKGEQEFVDRGFVQRCVATGMRTTWRHPRGRARPGRID
jgi:hypothetical protein